jgi:hypothetical protein
VQAGCYPHQAHKNIMTFPVVQSRNNGSSASGTNSTINLPSGLSNGDLCIVFVGIVNGTISTPSGWTQLFDLAVTPAPQFACYYRVCDGSEGTTLAITTSASIIRHYACYRITGYSSPPESATTQGSGSSGAVVDPPSLSPSWGAKDTLWFAVGSAENAISNLSGTPTSYSNTIGDATPHLSSSERQNNTATENPSAYTINNTASWGAATVAVQPASATGYKFRSFFLG